MYFNYHGRAKKLIRQGSLVSYEITANYNNIRPALVLRFIDHAPMPIREDKFTEYLILIEQSGLTDKIVIPQPPEPGLG